MRVQCPGRKSNGWVRKLALHFRYKEAAATVAMVRRLDSVARCTTSSPVTARSTVSSDA